MAEDDFKQWRSAIERTATRFDIYLFMILGSLSLCGAGVMSLIQGFDLLPEETGQFFLMLLFLMGFGVLFSWSLILAFSRHLLESIKRLESAVGMDDPDGAQP